MFVWIRSFTRLIMDWSLIRRKRKRAVSLTVNFVLVITVVVE
jgi:hypothetical protein